MSALDEERVSVIAQITMAFRDVIRGEGTSLHETSVLDDYGDEAARLEARALDTDAHWWEIPDEVLDRTGPLFRFYFFYLDGQGLRYYLPAWMIHSLRHFGAPPNGRRNTMSDLLDMLTLSDKPDLAAWGKNKWEILTVEQSQVICRYLRCVANYHQSEYKVRDAEKGLRQHWGRFCENGPVL